MQHRKITEEMLIKCLSHFFFMRCSRCGKCCEKTEMLLSKADMQLLRELRYSLIDYTICDNKGFIRLKNMKGYCVFYDFKTRKCKIYESKPLGCRIYPIMFSEEEGVIVDDLCPVKNTVSKRELKHKGGILVELLKRIDCEAEKRDKVLFYYKG